VLVDMAAERNIDMPIATAVAAVLDGKLDIDAAIDPCCAPIPGGG